MEFGIQAIFGPSDPLLGAHIQSICEALDIPHVEARIDFEPSFKEFSINLHPSQEHMNHAFKDVMAFLNWTKVAIVYEEDYGKIQSSYKYSHRLENNLRNVWLTLEAETHLNII
jgi:ionotropic kainate glutamate receptor 2